MHLGRRPGRGGENSIVEDGREGSKGGRLAGELGFSGEGGTGEGEMEFIPLLGWAFPTHPLQS